jgi:hypothetical protein
MSGLRTEGGNFRQQCRVSGRLRRFLSRRFTSLLVAGSSGCMRCRAQNAQEGALLAAPALPVEGVAGLVLPVEWSLRSTLSAQRSLGWLAGSPVCWSGGFSGSAGGVAGMLGRFAGRDVC